MLMKKSTFNDNTLFKKKNTAQIIMGKKPEPPKKVYLKTKTGDIVIDKLDSYIEPVKMVREARGDVSKTIK